MQLTPDSMDLSVLSDSLQGKKQKVYTHENGSLRNERFKQCK